MIMPCPECPERIEVSEEDPDGSLSDLWAHLGRHAHDRAARMKLFIQAQENAR
jgi:hypothetical protein